MSTDDFSTSLDEHNATHTGRVWVQPEAQLTATVRRYERQAEELPQVLMDHRHVENLAAWDFLVLRRAGGMWFEERDLPAPQPDWAEPIVPGLVIEGARFLEHDGYPAVEITVWASGAMHLLIVSQDTPVTLLTVALPQSEG
jgi:hypothetical protein